MFERKPKTTMFSILKTFLANETWARFNWEQRVTVHPQICVSFLAKPSSKQVTYHYPKFAVKCITLSQMQF